MNKIFIVFKTMSLAFREPPRLPEGLEIAVQQPRRHDANGRPIRRNNGADIEEAYREFEVYPDRGWLFEDKPHAEEAANYLATRFPNDKFVVLESISLFEVVPTTPLYKVWSANGELKVA